jgi:hypothetical protein
VVGLLEEIDAESDVSDHCVGPAEVKASFTQKLVHDSLGVVEVSEVLQRPNRNGARIHSYLFTVARRQGLSHAVESSLIAW